MNAETALTGEAEKGPNLGAMIKMLLKESKGEAYVSVEGVIPHPAPCRTVARNKHSPVPPPRTTGTTPLGLESATATSERKSTHNMTVRFGHTGHAGSVHPFFLQPSLRHSPDDLFPHMWTVHTHILKMDSFARIRFVQLSLLQPTQLSRPPTSRSGAEAADGFGPPNFPKLASTD
jgi:hypothetical protein